MTDFEPYVADAAERQPPPRGTRLRPLLIVAIVAIVVGALVGPLLRDRQTQDPSFEIPTEQQPS